MPAPRPTARTGQPARSLSWSWSSPFHCRPGEVPLLVVRDWISHAVAPAIRTMAITPLVVLRNGRDSSDAGAAGAGACVAAAVAAASRVASLASTAAASVTGLADT